ncbi:hypothetical protein EIN_378380 [Entamoeba invadens IP1]|uniref:Uncharacterized protein n=1 Tax=Entamoeba invadens IP1 TaxID=370355 RepID=A0A0A1TW72_ENTIV|nr:hypothetical protein EIN_378380 [Entamoeba invadens IP1]ELP83533.1 hypothetical protein EIN_378380 [Entamoeba invadens IP1]|eukprot:XP_004182879.1 hypothetical protein EIN_378380 [Entamoeba invadens IP1]
MFGPTLSNGQYTFNSFAEPLTPRGSTQPSLFAPQPVYPQTPIKPQAQQSFFNFGAPQQTSLFQTQPQQIQTTNVPPSYLFSDMLESSGTFFFNAIDYTVQGSRKAVYADTVKYDPQKGSIVYKGINAMQQYTNTTPLELRARDYAMSNNQRPYLN